ncbi:MAG: MCE family protein [Gammaproteobacteria bacterium]|nr:MCE family protein [Gammaproteobacteria bacterium]
MKRDTVNYLVVGLFVTAIAGAFFIFMYFVTGRAGPTDHYFAFYANVTGIKFGTGVFYEGYRVGQVEAVEPTPLPQGVHYKVTLSVAKDWRIPVDSVAEVVSAGLISQVRIEIRAGHASELLQPDAEIRGLQKADLFAALSRAANGFNDLSQTGVTPILHNLNERISQVADELKTFREGELSPFIARLDHSLNDELAPHAARVLTRLDADAARLERFLGPEHEAQVGEFLTQINDAAVNLNTLIARIEATRAELDTVVGSVGRLASTNEPDLTAAVRNARSSLEQMAATLTAINERVDSVMYNLDGSAQQIHELTRALRDNPTRLLRAPAPAVNSPP